jgi:hypothetical protein
MSICSPLVSACTSRHESPLQRYVFHFSYAHELVNKLVPESVNRPVRQSTPLTMIRFSTHFIFCGRLCSKRIFLESFTGTGPPNAGGTSWCMFVGDGDALYWGLPLISVFASFVHLAHAWQGCSHIRPLFLSLLVMIVEIMDSRQKMKRE